MRRGADVYFKQCLHDETGCASYFIASRQTRDAAVVDPQYDIEPYIELADERGYRITLVIDTHIHADHVSGNRRLAAATGAALYLYQDADVLFAYTPLKDGDELHLGQITLRALHTPGHRPESMSVVVTNTDRSTEPSMVLSGDCLFVGDVGRPDFGGPEGVLQEYDSIQKLLKLEDYVEVFPAHFEGSCGKSMCGRPSSTIGFERRFNPVLQLSKVEFQKQAAITPARPLNMTAIIETNRGVADHSWVRAQGGLFQAPTITVDEAPAWLRNHTGALVVDVREPAEYAAGHLPQALSVPQADLALRLDEIPKNRDVLVVCEAGNRSLKSTGFLIDAGYDRVVNLGGGTSAWKRAGLPVEAAPVSAEALVRD
jgi:glyoxylase-like metal-dependent hydrolase (beta-lactamase superfamily II)/rhodanese-related sulfurtransferase